VGERLWSNLLKVSIVRNFYDVEVSRYFWRNRFSLPSGKSQIQEDFESFVVSTGPAKTNARVVDDLEQFDFIIDFGNLERDLQRVVSHCGLEISVDATLPREKSGLRPEWATDYRAMYSLRAREAVQAKYCDQLTKMGQVF